MALTFFRWVALALVGFALVPVLVLRDTPRRAIPKTELDRLRERAGRAKAQVELAADRLRRREIHDSIRTELARSRQDSGTVLFDQAFDPVTRASLEGLARRADSARASIPRVKTDIVMVRDTSRSVRGQERRGIGGAMTVDYLLPRPGGEDESCVVVARIQGSTEGGERRGNAAAELNSEISSQRLLGPCAFYEHFGHPGPSINRWLLSRGWSFAQRGDWRSESPDWSSTEWFQQFGDRVELTEVIGPEGISCAAGDDEACLRAILDREISARRQPVRDGTVSTADYNPFSHTGFFWYTNRWDLGAREWTVLADMARDLGPERFGAFWRSELDPEQGFHAATGESLAEWTREWIEDTYKAFRPGPVIAGGTLGMGVLLLILSGAVAVTAARRRQAA